MRFKGVAHWGAIAVSGGAAGSPSHLIGVLVCGGAAGCFDATELWLDVPVHDAAPVDRIRHSEPTVSYALA
jgi:hypothetical protein